MVALYERERPTGFNEIIGNENVINTLSTYVEKKKNNQDHPHVFLFKGPYGCGKTTIGSILAKELGSTGSDFREIDSADFRGIDYSREIRRQMLYRPVESSCRVWLMDECHKMTPDAQEALLKAFEKTPKHVYFILCTTDPQTMKKTLIDRCTPFEVRLLNNDEMLKLLRVHTKREGVKLQKNVYEQIIVTSEGHPRSALVLLEHVLATDPEDRLEAAKQNKLIETEAIDLCRALIKGNGWGEVSRILKGLEKADMEHVRLTVLRYCTTVLLSNDNPRAGLIMEHFINPFYNSKFPGLVYACYYIHHS